MNKNKSDFAIFCIFLIGVMVLLWIRYSASYEQTANDVYDGTYNEDVLRKLNQDVVIGNQHFSLPCSIQEMGKDFSLKTDSQTGEFIPISQRVEDFIWTILCYQGKPVAQIYYAVSKEENHDYSNDPILRMNIFGDDTNWSVGGIEKGKTSYKQIVEKLGNPGKYDTYSKDYKTMVYGEHRLQIMLGEDDLVEAIWMLVNTDKPREKQAEAISFDGKWHKDSLKQLNSKFIINGRSFPMPFAVKDLGLDFELMRDTDTGDFYTEEVPGTDAVILELQFGGDPVGHIFCTSSSEPHHDYRADPVRAVFWQDSDGPCSFTIPLLEPGLLSEEKLIQKLGKPELEYRPQYMPHLMIYEDQGFVARIDQDGIADGFYMEDPAHRLTSISSYLPQDDFHYNGSCDQETIDHLAQSIQIHGQNINIYGGRDSMGDFAQEISETADSEAEFWDINVDDDMIGMITYHQEEDQVKRIQFWEPKKIISLDNQNIYWLSMGNILLSCTTKEEIIEMFGEPEKIKCEGTMLCYRSDQLQIDISTTGRVDSVTLHSDIPTPLKK